ncbi:hypothetical protein CDL12_17172 [Handroanthus impetiginosus]|uniref:DUF4371 domain-containing protein n=1 Tax=Handroanthus impetiginosus TaxID=429701 RepID=A0A2G9GY78_9LAMI|nr:hypothetical protein CDL12_17172 [Handroanthus impetiginosus]
MKEQVAVALLYVNKKGYVIEHFIGIVHNTSAFYIHYFAHQLQLTLVTMAKNLEEMADVISSFDIIFKLHLMWKMFGITNELSQALQRKDEDITNEMKLVRILKDQLQKMRDEKWDSLLIGVFSFCEKINFGIPDINCLFVQGQSREKKFKDTNFHLYRVELFYTVIDM